MRYQQLSDEVFLLRIQRWKRRLEYLAFLGVVLIGANVYLYYNRPAFERLIPKRDILIVATELARNNYQLGGTASGVQADPGCTGQSLDDALIIDRVQTPYPTFTRYGYSEQARAVCMDVYETVNPDSIAANLPSVPFDPSPYSPFFGNFAAGQPIVRILSHGVNFTDVDLQQTDSNTKLLSTLYLRLGGGYNDKLLVPYDPDVESTKFLQTLQQARLGYTEKWRGGLWLVLALGGFSLFRLIQFCLFGYVQYLRRYPGKGLGFMNFVLCRDIPAAHRTVQKLRLEQERENDAARALAAAEYKLRQDLDRRLIELRDAFPPDSPQYNQACAVLLAGETTAEKQSVVNVLMPQKPPVLPERNHRQAKIEEWCHRLREMTPAEYAHESEAICQRAQALGEPKFLEAKRLLVEAIAARRRHNERFLLMPWERR